MTFCMAGRPSLPFIQNPDSSTPEAGRGARRASTLNPYSQTDSTSAFCMIMHCFGRILFITLTSNLCMAGRRARGAAGLDRPPGGRAVRVQGVEFL
jgi:hypothetical protein